MKALAKQAFEAALLSASRAMPRRLMAHYMFLLNSNPALADSWGYHVRPIHYYEPLPDFRSISTAQLRRRRRFPSIKFPLDQQVEFLIELGGKYRTEISAIAAASGYDFCNPYFPGVDACAYYAIIRHLQPQKIVEVGSGFSTQIASLALRRNKSGGAGGELLCIEPHPEDRLIKSDAQFTLVPKPVQDLDQEIFVSLSPRDILFIDSSHVASTGSDVCIVLLEILPQLQAGVWVHVHDIFFPEDYPPEWVIERRTAFNEQYMLEAFLSFNSVFSVRLANHWMWLDHRDAVKALCPDVAITDGANEMGPASFWICRDPLGRDSVNV
jgi:Methyltransferase domain